MPSLPSAPASHEGIGVPVSRDAGSRHSLVILRVGKVHGELESGAGSQSHPTNGSLTFDVSLSPFHP